MAKIIKPADNDSEILVLPDEPDDMELSILSEMNATEDDVTWKFEVNRVTGPAKLGNKEPFLFDGDASEIAGLKIRLRDECGTGTYRVRIKRNGILYRRFDISVETPARTPIAPPSEMGAVLAAIQASNEKTMQLIERMAERNAQPASFDPVAMMTSMAAIMKNFQVMMAPVAQPVATSDQNSVKLFLEGVNFAKDLEPTKHSTGMTGLVERLLESPLLAKLAEGVGNTPMVPPGAGAPGGTGAPLNLPPPRNRPATAPAPGPSGLTSAPAPVRAVGAAPPVSPVQAVAPDNEGEELAEVMPTVAPTPQEFMAALQSNPQLQENVGNAISYLVTRAEKGAEPQFYADWVLDNWPDELITVLLEIPDLVSQLQHFVPAVAPHRNWFEILVAEVREIVKDEEGVSGSEVVNAPELRPAPAVASHGDTRRPGGRESDVGDHVAGSQKG